MAATKNALSEQNIADIVSKMEDGLNLLQVCRAAGVNYGNVARRIHESPELTALYARSRSAYAHAKVDELHDIAINEPDVMRARLRCDVLKWEISKVLPKIYGERTVLDVTTTNKVDMTREEMEAEFKQLLRSRGLCLVSESQVIDAETKRLEQGDE